MKTWRWPFSDYATEAILYITIGLMAAGVLIYASFEDDPIPTVSAPITGYANIAGVETSDIPDGLYLGVNESGELGWYTAKQIQKFEEKKHRGKN